MRKPACVDFFSGDSYDLAPGGGPVAYRVRHPILIDWGRVVGMSNSAEARFHKKLEQLSPIDLYGVDLWLDSGSSMFVYASLPLEQWADMAAYP